jgi:DNA polymerase (family X)
VRILIDSDAHGVNTLGITRWGVATARRAWLTKDDVVNTLPFKQFAALRKRAASAKQAR